MQNVQDLVLFPLLTKLLKKVAKGQRLVPRLVKLCVSVETLAPTPILPVDKGLMQNDFLSV